MRIAGYVRKNSSEKYAVSLIYKEDDIPTTISSVEASASPSGLTVAAASFSGRTVTTVISVGVNAGEYNLKFKVTTAEGYIYEDYVVVNVDDD